MKYDFAIHMRNKKTNEKRIKKVNVEDPTYASCDLLHYGSDWVWTGTEPWHNVDGKVKHIGKGYYSYTA